MRGLLCVSDSNSTGTFHSWCKVWGFHERLKSQLGFDYHKNCKFIPVTERQLQLSFGRCVTAVKAFPMPGTEQLWLLCSLCQVRFRPAQLIVVVYAQLLKCMTLSCHFSLFFTGGSTDMWATPAACWGWGGFCTFPLQTRPRWLHGHMQICQEPSGKDGCVNSQIHSFVPFWFEFHFLPVVTPSWQMKTKRIDRSACSPDCRILFHLTEDQRGYNVILRACKNESMLEEKTFHFSEWLQTLHHRYGDFTLIL